MASNWEDDFDFDEPSSKNKTNVNNTKKKTDFDNQFVDFENDRAIKLPSINNNRTNNNNNKGKAFQEVGLEEIKDKKKEKSPMTYDMPEQPDVESLEESIAYEPSPKPKVKDIVTSPMKMPKQPVLKIPNQLDLKKEAQQEYGEENFEEENYEEDFQANQEKPTVSPVSSKIKSTGKEQKLAPPKPTNIPKPVATQRRGVGSVSRKVEPPVRGNSRINSRNSGRSQSKNSVRSKPKVEQKKEENTGPNRYVNFAEKHCPSYDDKTLEQFSLDKLTRQNERARNTIKKLNDQLNDLINRNILQLKGKKTQKQINQDDVIKQLQELKISNETALQTSIKDLAKLKNKEGALKEEEYHLSLDQSIIDTKNSISECTKFITKMKYDIDNEGKKLTKMDKADKELPTIEMGNIKASSINAQKQFQKHEEQLQKLQQKLEELNKKVTEVEKKHNTQLEEAKRKGISVIINPELHKKAEELKKKIDTVKQHKATTESLFKSKGQVIGHENEQIRIQIKQIENVTLTCHANCEEMQKQSKKTVEKAKKGGKFPQQMLSALQLLISQMEIGLASYKQSENEEKNILTHPKGAKKYQSVKNMDKIIPQVARQASKTTHQDDSNLNKPVLFKKKKDEEEKSYRTQKVERKEERVWKEEASTAPLKSNNGKGSVQNLTKFEDKQQVKQQKKKPFMIKRNKDKSLEEHKQSPVVNKIQPVKTIEEPKNEQTPNIAPRMMKFRRNKQEIPKEESKPMISNDKTTEQARGETREEDDKPSFVPRRFNLKLKDRKSEDVGYVASTAEKKDELKRQETKQSGLTLTKEQTTAPPAQEEEIKPTRFNLKLRDRQKENNPEPKTEYQPRIEQPAKIAINLSDQPKPSKQNSNPYNPYAQAYEGRKKQKKDKEGPIKESKPTITAPKQKYDLFGQAEDLDNIAQIKAQSPKPAYTSSPQNEEIDLNTLLGKPKVAAKKEAIEEDLLVDDSLFGKK